MHDGINCQGTDTLAVEFFDDIFAVRDDSGKAHVQSVGYLLVDKALYNKGKYLNLTVRQHPLSRRENRRNGKTAAMRVGTLF